MATAWRLDSRRVLGQLVLMVVTGFAGGVGLLLLIPIVNSVASVEGEVRGPLVGPLASQTIPLAVLLAMFVLAVAGVALATRAASVNAVRMRQQVVDRMRQEAFDSVLAARWLFVLNLRGSDLVEIVTMGAARAGMAYEQLMRLGITGLVAVVTAAVAVVVAPLVAGLAVGAMLVVGLGWSVSIRSAHRIGLDYGRRSRHLQGVLTDSIGSLRLIRAHDAAAVWSTWLESAFQGTRELELAHARRHSAVTAVAQIGIAAAAALLVLVAVWRQMPAGSIVLTLLLVARLARSVQAMGSIAAQLAYALPGVHDVLTLTGEAHAAVESPAATAPEDSRLVVPRGQPLLQMQDVTYTYPGSAGGVRDVTLHLPAGEITVLTGPSGAGKSTTADLALGLLSPQSGQVVVDGRPLAPNMLAWWRQHVAYVPQETVLLPASLRDNLTWSVPGGASDEACWHALDRAAAAFAHSLPEGLDTPLGDRAARLSGGERQRIAIARALLRSPALLVLDEATSSLDDVTEAEILDLVSSLVPAVTVLVIAHRKSTVGLAHHLVCLLQGRRVAEDRCEVLPSLPERE